MAIEAELVSVFKVCMYVKWRAFVLWVFFVCGEVRCRVLMPMCACDWDGV